MPRPSAISRTRVENVFEAKKLCIIATEDSDTGAFRYFEELRPSLKKYSIQLEVIPSKDGKSAPSHVLENLKNQIKEKFKNSLDLNDKCWIVCDIDNWKNQHINKVIAECIELKFNQAFSNPCSEIWILYHQKTLDDTNYNSQACKKAANELLSKNKGYKNLIQETNIKYAINHAEKLHRPKQQKWPEKQGSHLYKLVKELIS